VESLLSLVSFIAMYLVVGYGHAYTRHKLNWCGPLIMVPVFLKLKIVPVITMMLLYYKMEGIVSFVPADYRFIVLTLVGFASELVLNRLLGPEGRSKSLSGIPKFTSPIDACIGVKKEELVTRLLEAPNSRDMLVSIVASAEHISKSDKKRLLARLDNLGADVPKVLVFEVINVVGLSYALGFVSRKKTV
jgi:hypothetical protein